MIDPVSVLLPVIRGGWKVFPITAGAKKPPLILDFPNSASGDITQIQAWATQHVGCNWAVSLSMSNVFCLDLDGTAGGRWLAAQEKSRGLSWTCTRRCKSASGGTHFYYRMPSPEIHSSTSEIATGVDIKGWHSYALIPPSLIQGSSYSWLGPSSLAPQNAPDWLIALARAASEKKSQPESSSSPTIIPEGERNARLASIAGTLRRRNLSEAAIGAALAVHNTETCVPPLDPVEVQEIASSIACYKPEPVLRIRPVNTKPPVTAEDSQRITQLEQIPDPRTLRTDAVKFLVDDLIPANQVTLIAGEYGCGKTFLGMTLARAIMRGTAFLGRDVMRRETVIYLDRENPLSVAQERLGILFAEEEPAYRHWGLWCQDEPPALSDSRLLDFASRGAVIFFDSFVRFHDCDENSPSQMATVMKHLRKLQSAGGTIIALHHRSKALDSAFRGTGEIAAGCDVLYSLSRKEPGLLELASAKDRLGVTAKVTFSANWGEGVIETAEAGETTVKRALTAKIRSLIESSPGLSQTQIIAALKGSAGRNQILRILGQREDDLWRTEKNGTKVYFPKLRIKK